jgi:DNA-binding LacI/PurR family transcriptional regulator
MSGAAGFAFADTRTPPAGLAGTGRPDAVFGANDTLAIGFMDVARREFGLDITGDLSVVGFDDIAMARWPSHSMTTVRQPMGQMLDVTMEMIGMLFGSAQLEPRIERFPGELIERASTHETAHVE